MSQFVCFFFFLFLQNLYVEHYYLVFMSVKFLCMTLTHCIVSGMVLCVHYPFDFFFLTHLLVCQACHDKHQRLGCLSCRNLLSHSSGSWKPKTEVLAGLVSPKDSLLGFSDGYIFAVSSNGLFSMHIYAWYPCLLGQAHHLHWISILPICSHVILITSLKT